jgi:hypothetical protein
VILHLFRQDDVLVLETLAHLLPVHGADHDGRHCCLSFRPAKAETGFLDIFVEKLFSISK